MRAEAGRAAETTVCDELAPVLGGVADASHQLTLTERRHVETCLRCQAELVQYRRLLRTLRSLRHEVLEPGPGRLTEVLANLEAAGERRAIRAVLQQRRAAYVGGIAAAAAAGAAGAVVFAVRTRRSA